jgi:hypothetical protein
MDITLDQIAQISLTLANLRAESYDHDRIVTLSDNLQGLGVGAIHVQTRVAECDDDGWSHTAGFCITFDGQPMRDLPGGYVTFQPIAKDGRGAKNLY